MSKHYAAIDVCIIIIIVIVDGWLTQVASNTGFTVHVFSVHDLALLYRMCFFSTRYTYLICAPDYANIHL